MVSSMSKRVLGLIAVIAVSASVVTLAFATTATAKNVRWESPVIVGADARYMCLDLFTGVDGTYVLSWEHPDGRVLLFKSLDGGATWGTPVDVFGTGVYPGYTSMCVYPDGDDDTILVAVGPCHVARSTDSGETFQMLADVPVPAYGAWYTSGSIATNASWSGGEPDDDIYFVGALYVGVPWSGRYVLHSSVSHDGGLSWTAPVVVSTEDYESFWPEVLSDGQRLYVAHSVAGSMDLHIKYSDDWGATWHDGGDPVTAEGVGGIAALKMQPLDANRAFVTVWDIYESGGTGFARCGYLMYDDMSFKESFRVENPEWHFGMFGLNVEMVSMADYNIAWIEQAPDGTYAIMFADSAP